MTGSWTWWGNILGTRLALSGDGEYMRDKATKWLPASSVYALVESYCGAQIKKRWPWPYARTCSRILSDIRGQRTLYAKLIGRYWIWLPSIVEASFAGF